MKKMIVAMLCIAVCCGIAGLVLRLHAEAAEERHKEYAAAIGEFKKSVEMYRAGLCCEEADKLVQSLDKMMAAHKGQKEWEKLVPYKRLAEGLVAYGKADKMLARYSKIQLAPSKEKLPASTDLLDQYSQFEKAFREIAGNPAFSDPDIAWRMENDIATSIVWQMAVKISLQDAKPEDAKPLYDAAKAEYEKAMKSAEKAGAQKEGIADPRRFVSQNLDFMTRLQESQQEQQQQPQRGYGKMLDGSKASDQDPTLPKPMMSIGKSRITGGVK
jgi:hypothetical protein